MLDNFILLRMYQKLPVSLSERSTFQWQWASHITLKSVGVLFVGLAARYIPLRCREVTIIGILWPKHNDGAEIGSS